MITEPLPHYYRQQNQKFRYRYFVVLGRHPEHINLRDPRRAWQYTCCSGKHWAEDYENIRGFKMVNDDDFEFGDRIYYFENEQDMLMFNLRWQNTDH